MTDNSVITMITSLPLLVTVLSYIRGQKFVMKVSSINKFFEKIGAWQLRFRWQILIALCAVSALCLAGLPKGPSKVQDGKRRRSMV